jgi:hypothetical protein
MDFLRKLEWKQVVIALAAVGVISTSDPEAAFISVLAMAIVFVVNLAAKAQNKPVGRGWVSLLVYGVAFAMTIVAHPPVVSLPIWTGDPAIYTVYLAQLLAEFGPTALAMTGSATILYNALSKLVFERLENGVLGG